jgi:kinesin family protein C2/C3
VQLKQTEDAVKNSADASSQLQQVQIDNLTRDKEELEEKLKTEREQSSAALQQLRGSIEQEKAQAAERSNQLMSSSDREKQELLANFELERKEAFRRDLEVSDKLKAAQQALAQEQKKSAKLVQDMAIQQKQQASASNKLVQMQKALQKNILPAFKDIKSKQQQLQSMMSQWQRQYADDMVENQTTTVQHLDALVHKSLRKMEVILTQKEQRINQMNVKMRKLHNEIQDLKGNIRVLCRVRPLSDAEDRRMETYAVTFPEDDIVCLQTAGREGASGSGRTEEKPFQYNRVFPPAYDQQQVFAEAEPLVTSVMDGYNVCMFAYGQTGSGKTHTMEGPKPDRGVYFRAVKEMFRIAQEREAKWNYSITMSVLEIYNEKLIDLLNDKRTRKIDDDEEDQADAKLEIYHEQDGAVEVKNLTQVSVGSVAEVEREIEHGSRNRSTFATKINEHSSRSHLVVSFRVRGQDVKGITTYYSKMHLVDLAGSERIAKSEATGDRLKEAQHINKSLSALGDVMAALGTKKAHIPYRNSKLTTVLQDSLGGNAKVLMFVALSPTTECASETLCSLNFASRVAKVELGQAKRNVLVEKQVSSEGSAGRLGSGKTRVKPERSGGV